MRASANRDGGVGRECLGIFPDLICRYRELLRLCGCTMDTSLFVFVLLPRASQSRATHRRTPPLRSASLVIGSIARSMLCRGSVYTRLHTRCTRAPVVETRTAQQSVVFVGPPKTDGRESFSRLARPGPAGYQTELHNPHGYCIPIDNPDLYPAIRSTACSRRQERQTRRKYGGR